MKNKTDNVGIFISIGCMIHCILMPVLLPILPAAGFVIDHGPLVHGVLVFIIATVALLSFIPGYKKHKNHTPRSTAAVGIFILTVMGVVELTGYSSTPITIFTIIGSLTIAYAHYLNHKYLCACSCAHHGERSCH